MFLKKLRNIRRVAHGEIEIWKMNTQIYPMFLKEIDHLGDIDAPEY
jgi:hypothetical protein